VTACLLKNEPASYTFVAMAKAGSCRSRRETESEQGASRKGGWQGVDPKPCDLPMARLKVR
jgi:hypothetical protein